MPGDTSDGDMVSRLDKSTSERHLRAAELRRAYKYDKNQGNIISATALPLYYGGGKYCLEMSCDNLSIIKFTKLNGSSPRRAQTT